MAKTTSLESQIKKILRTAEWCKESELDGYVATLAYLLSSGDSTYAIANYLIAVEVADFLHPCPDATRATEIAHRLVTIMAEIKNQRLSSPPSNPA